METVNNPVGQAMKLSHGVHFKVMLIGICSQRVKEILTPPARQDLQHLPKTLKLYGLKETVQKYRTACSLPQISNT